MSHSEIPGVVGFTAHDHSRCQNSGMRAAEQLCAEKRLRLTPARRRVLEHLLASHKALGAYDLLELLRQEGLGSQPPVVYRALEFLTTHGMVHKLERLNAFVACAHSHGNQAHSPAFLICRACRSVAETALPVSAHRPVAETAAALGFSIDHMSVEAEGLCPDCQGAAP